MTTSKPLHKRVLGPPYRFLRARLSRVHPRRFLATGRWLVDVVQAVRRRRRERRLTVAVDVSMLWEPLTGIGWYVFRILDELSTREDLVLRLYGPSLAAAEMVEEPAAPLPCGPSIELVLYPVPAESLFHADSLIRLVRRFERWLIAADGNDVAFAPNFFPPARFELAVRSGGARLVATIHDLTFRLFPWTMAEETRNLLSRHLDRVLREAAWIVTPSETVRRELARTDLASPARVRAVHHGPGQLTVTEPGPRPEWAPARFGLFVGTLEPRKNLETLLEAWRLLRRRLEDPPDLVVCGRFGWKDEGLRHKVAEARAEGWLHHPGYVPNEELAALFRHALLLAFPSYYEGFGLPVLEAFAAETPVVASDLPVLREVAGDAALFAPPDRPEVWARRLAQLATDPDLRERLSARGRARATRFSWRQAAEEHAQVFRAAGRPGT